MHIDETVTRNRISNNHLTRITSNIAGMLTTKPNRGVEQNASTMIKYTVNKYIYYLIS